MNKILIRPDELKNIIEWAWANPLCDIYDKDDLLNEAAMLFMEDVSQFEDKYYMYVEYNIYKYRFLCTKEEYNVITNFKGTLNLSKNINVKWDDVMDNVLTDPYDISRLYNPVLDIMPKWAVNIINHTPLDKIFEEELK